MSDIVKYIAPGGMLLIICRGRDKPQNPGVSPPWALTKEELSFFATLGLKKLSFEDFFNREEPPVRRFRLTYSY